jgi:methionyl-tRNA synthetase
MAGSSPERFATVTMPTHTTLVRKLGELESEPHGVRFKDLYPWDAIDDTPFGASHAVIEGGGRTMLHSHDPAETFVICRGQGTIVIDDTPTQVTPGDVIYLPPHSMHELRNASPAEELVFLSVFWSAPIEDKIDRTPRLLVPAPPTPNGTLHLGHLAGPYLIADVMRRYFRARGIPATLVCLVDEHQSYVADRAHHDGVTPAETATTFADSTLRVFDQLGAPPDVRIFPTRDAEYRAAIAERLGRLVASGAVEAREVESLYCEACRLALVDSYVYGTCPHCSAKTFGFSCEACSGVNLCSDLGEPICDRCERPASRRTTRQLVLPLAPYLPALAEYHRAIKLAPKLMRLAAQWLANPPPFVYASHPGDWGIAVPGLDGQVISSWFEVALATPYLRERHGGRLACFFGYDNAFLYLVHDPAVSLALDPRAPLTGTLCANEFLLLDDAKMSTSRSHAVIAEAILAKVPADLLRLYLAKLRPEDGRMNTSLPQAQLFMTFGRAVANEAGSRAPQPANTSLAPWPADQNRFLAQLGDLVERARRGYEELSLKEVSLAIHELIERAQAFGVSQAQLAGVPAFAGVRATGLALELVAAEKLAMITAPVMPAFAEQLWRALGFDGAIDWIDEVSPIPAGQAIDTRVLIERGFFPPVVQL